MELSIPKEVKKIWDAWNLRGCILLSLSLQIFLMLFASFRKKCRSKFLLVFIWSAYLLADWVAAVAVGIITQSQVDRCDAKGNKDLLAFWASFLLLHLGGPDTITSFALEDNEFWLRHLLGLVVQVLAAAYCFYLTPVQNKLLVPTVLVLVVGTVKFGERTCALYLACLDHPASPPVAGPDYEETVAIHSTMRSLEVPPTQVVVPITPNVGNGYKDPKFTVEGNLEESLNDKQLLQEAYDLLESFKGLIVGFLLSSKDRELCRDFFLSRTYSGAFKLIEYELSFMYEVLHTKVIVVRHKIGYTLRFLSFCATIVALVFFILVDKHEYDKFDIDLTYALFSGAIFLDTISVFRLIFSDWTLIALNNTNIWSRFIAAVILKGGRWSGSVSQYNMIKNCLDERPEWVFTFAGYLGFRGILGRIKIEYYSSSEAVTEELKYFLFQHLRIKSLRAADMEESSQRGDWALLQNSNYYKLQWSLGEYEYAGSVLLWHIATELYFAKSEAEQCAPCNGRECASNNPQNFCASCTSKARQRICKLVSDYMFYLLVMQYTMMAPVLGNWHIVFQDTCAEANRFFRKHSISDHKKACDMITRVEAKYRSAAVKGIKSKSVLFDACHLAKQLQELGADQWTLMTRLWIELLSYAAIKCRPIVHAQQPSRGGELLTFTWLLMNHLGLGTQFYELENQAATKKVAATKMVAEFKDHISKGYNGTNSDITQRLLEEIQNDLIPISEACRRLQEWEEYVSCAVKELTFQSLDDAFKERTLATPENSTNRSNFLLNKLNRTRSIVSRFKELVCSPSAMLGEELQRLNIDKVTALNEIEAIYKGFDKRLRPCFLCFSVFPEGAVIKKKVLIDWWVGESFIDDTLATGGGKTAEETGNEFFKQFLDKGIIEPVYKKRGPSADSFKMQPPIRYAVIELAKRDKFFDFDHNGNPTEDFSSSQRACLEGLRTRDKVMALKEMEAIYHGLNDTMKSCFLCFSVFPEGAVIKKKVLIHWWVGEGFIDTLATPTAEGTGNEFFKEFLDKGIIEPVYKKSRRADSCKMQPPIRYAVIELAKRYEFFNFDQNGNPTEDFSSSQRACLVRTIEGSNVRELPCRSSQENVRSLINVNEQYLYMRPNWFSKMKSVKVLQLGRWQGSAKHLIEAQNCEFLEGLKDMRELRYLSLRGVSRITELPASICKAFNLIIMNLNGCCDLEKLPQEIGSLKNLTHFDMDECYLISSMPKGLALLSQLQVLKGFVISKARPGGQDCTLADLSTLQSLRKLSIHIDKKLASTAESELNSLTKFKKLRSLSISWSRIYDKPATQTLHSTLKRTLAKKQTSMPKLTKRPSMAPIIAPDSPLTLLLEKLDLHYFPHSNMPNWLRSKQLSNLKKLYIRGGSLSDLCHSGIQCRWTVQMVRLKFLNELQMDWEKLQHLFPQLRYLEISECPKLSFDQCDENGVWERADSEQEEASSSNA